MASAQVRKLNGEFPPSSAGAVAHFKIAAAGLRVLYATGSTNPDGPFALHSVAIGGGTPVLLATEVRSFLVDASGSRVLFRAGTTAIELYSVSVLGGVPVRLNATLPAGGSIDAVIDDPTGARAVFLERSSGLYSAPADGSGSAVHLSADLTPAFFDVDPDFFLATEERVLFLVATPDDLRRLYSAPLDGSAAPIALTGPIFSQPDFHPNPALFRLSPAGERVAYLGDGAQGETELFSVPCDGSAPAVRLSRRALTWNDFRFTPDGLEVLFVQERSVCRAWSDGRFHPRVVDRAPADGTHVRALEISPLGERIAFVRATSLSLPGQLFSRRLVGGHVLPTAPQPRDPLLLSPPGHDPRRITFSRDGTQVVYESKPLGSFYGSLHSVPVDGSAPALELSAGLAVSDVRGRAFALGESDRVVFGADTGSVLELYSAPIDGSAAPVRVHPDLAPYGDALNTLSGTPAFEIDPSGTNVVYTAEVTGSPFVLFAAPIAGGSEVALNEPLPSGPTFADVQWFGVGADVERVAYLAPQTLPLMTELFSAPLSGPPVSTRLNADLPESGEVQSPVLTPDGSRVLFLADQEVEGEYDLFVAPLAGGPPLELAGSTIGTALGPLLVTAGGERAVFQAFSVVPRLYSVPLDASAAPTPLATCCEPVSEYRTTADGTRLVFRGSLSSGCVQQLYSVPVDGGQAPVRLNPDLVEGAEVPPGFLLGPDGTRVVFRVPAANGQHELYSALTDGRAPAVRINGTLVADGGTFWSYQIAPDSTHVVYETDQITRNKFELFAVPIDASAPAIRISHNLTASQDVSRFAIAANGQRVVYQALRNGAVLELWSAPIDASAPAVRLSGTFDSNGGVRDFLLHPDGVTVVYRADQEPYSGWNFFRVPITGGAAPMLLNDPSLPAIETQNLLPGVSTHFQLSPDGRWIVYRVRRDSVINDLYVATTNGTGRTVRINPEAMPGTVYDHRFTADSTGVVYMAEQEQYGVRELFLGRLLRGSPPTRER